MNNSTSRNNSSVRTEEILDLYFTYSGLLSLCVGVPTIAFVLGCSIYFIRFQETRSAPVLYHHFILSITVADLIFLIFHTGPLIVGRLIKIDISALHSVSCDVKIIFTHLSVVGSSASLLCLNVDKFLAIISPLRHAYLVTKRSVSGAVIGSWLVAVAWTAVFMFGPWTTVSYSDCVFTMDTNAYLVFSIVFFIAPIFLAAVFSSAIVAVAFRASRKCGNSNFEMSIHRRHRRIRATKIAFVFSTTLWSCVSCLPYRLLYIVMYHTRLDTELETVLGNIFYSFLILHPTGNAVLTLASQRWYRGILTWFLAYCSEWVKVRCSNVPSDRKRIPLPAYFSQAHTMTTIFRTTSLPNQLSHEEGSVRCSVVDNYK